MVEALARVIENRGGQLLTNAQVDRVLVEARDGAPAPSACSWPTAAACAPATPWSATSRRNNSYGQLLPDAPPPARERAQAYRYGRGCMQLHFALNAPPA